MKKDLGQLAMVRISALFSDYAKIDFPDLRLMINEIFSKSDRIKGIHFCGIDFTLEDQTLVLCILRPSHCIPPRVIIFQFNNGILPRLKFSENLSEHPHVCRLITFVISAQLPGISNGFREKRFEKLVW
jgi:hypothetical protein